MSLGLFYFDFVDAVHEGDGLRVLHCYKYLLLIFKSSQYHNYYIEVFNLLHQYYYGLSPRLANELIWNQFINTHESREKMLQMEHMNCIVKEAIRTKGTNKIATSFSHVGKAMGTLEPLLNNFDHDNTVTTPSSCHTTISCKADMDI